MPRPTMTFTTPAPLTLHGLPEEVALRLVNDVLDQAALAAARHCGVSGLSAMHTALVTGLLLDIRAVFGATITHRIVDAAMRQLDRRELDDPVDPSALVLAAAQAKSGGPKA